MNLISKTLLFLIVVVLVLFLLDKTTSLEISPLKLLRIGQQEVMQLDDKTNERDDEENGHVKEAERIHIVDGYKGIHVEDEVIDAAGLKFANPVSMTFRPEFTAYAEVIDIAPLVAAKTRYINLKAELKILQNDLHNNNLILKRAEALHKIKSLSTRELEQNRADRDLKATQLAAMTTRLDNLVYDIKSDWGKEISRLVLDIDKQDLFDKLASHKSALIQISLLKDKILDSDQQNVYVSNRNQRDTALQVTYLDQAIRVNNQLFGESYYYFLDSGRFLPGIRLFAWIEESGDPLSGLFIPDSAVIWYANEPWIYIKHDDHLFVRKPLLKARKLADGWLTVEGVSQDDQVVIHGGQTLLSEEFKWAIPDEDDD